MLELINISNATAVVSASTCTSSGRRRMLQSGSRFDITTDIVVPAASVTDNLTPSRIVDQIVTNTNVSDPSVLALYSSTMEQYAGSDIVNATAIQAAPPSVGVTTFVLSSSSSSSSSSDGDSLSTGAVAGIVVGCIAGVVVLIALALSFGK